MKKGRDTITHENYRLFRAEVCKQLSLRGWKYKDLAEATAYMTTSIAAFMNGSRVNDNVAEAIAKALDIPAHMAT